MIFTSGACSKRLFFERFLQRISRWTSKKGHKLCKHHTTAYITHALSVTRYVFISIGLRIAYIHKITLSIRNLIFCDLIFSVFKQKMY